MAPRTRSAPGLAVTAGVVCASVLVLLAGDAAAQSDRKRVGLVRTTEAAAELVRQTDDALLRDLASIAGVENPTASSMELADIQLSVGCEGASPDCLAAVADTLQVDCLLVRGLRVDEAGTATLELMRFDSQLTPNVVIAHASETKGREAELVDQIPRLVREVFMLPEPAVPAQDPGTQPGPAKPPVPVAVAPHDASLGSAPADRGASVAPITWVTLGVGAAALGAGIVLGLSAETQYDDFQSTRVESPEDAEHLREEFDALETRGTIATVLMPVGGAILGLGATLLVMDLMSGSEGDSKSPRVAIAPSTDGGLLTVHGRLEAL